LVAVAIYATGGVNPVTCNYGVASFYVTIVQCVAAAVLLGVSGYVLWGISDVFYIKQEFIFALAVGLPLFFLWIASEVLSWSGLAISDFWVGLGENLFLLCGILLLLNVGSLCQINIEMRDREEIMEKIDAALFSDDLLSTAEKSMTGLMRQSILPLWRASASYREAMKEYKVRDLEELRAQRQSKSKTTSKITFEEFQVEE